MSLALIWMLPNILKDDWLLQDSLVIQVLVIQLNVHRQIFFQCMDNFTQQLVQKYQTGSYPQYPDCGGANITLTASRQAIECPVDSVLNKTDPICSKCATSVLFYKAHATFLSLLDNLTLLCRRYRVSIWLYFLCMRDKINGDFFSADQCDLGYYANQSSQSCERCPSLESGILIPWDCKLCDSDPNTTSCLSKFSHSQR